MKRIAATASKFGYFRDPVFLAALALYLINKWILKPLEGPHGGFFHNYVNDILCIPVCLPAVLWAYRQIRFRNHDRMPTRLEVMLHLIVWSIYFEGIAPRLGGVFSWTRGDLWDVVAYAAGAAIACLYWGTFRSNSTARATESVIKQPHKIKKWLGA